MKYQIIIFSLLLLPLANFGQQLPFDLYGEEARAWIKQNYYDAQHDELSYSEARKKMFAYIVNRNDSIECVYSGLKQAHPYGWEISFPDPFNTEHVVPQSLFGSNEPMRSDIHILQPAYDDWNNLRSNYEFKELPDQTTQQWIYLDQSTSSIPTSNIDLYSEYVQFGWEARESRKGDVARAILYFFTMYPQYANNLDDVIQPELLCLWHEIDEVSAYERLRDERTATYQGNINPFVTYPHWANQAWGCNVEEPPVVAVVDTFSVEIEVNTTEVVCVDNYFDLQGFTRAGICDDAGLTVAIAPDLCVTVTGDSDDAQADTLCVYHCDGDLCDTTYIVVTSVPVVSGIAQATAEISVYPNPSNGQVRLTLAKWSDYPLYATFTDTSGKTVMNGMVRGSEVFLNTPEAAGTYFLYLRTRQGALAGQTSIVVNGR